ncbi:MAG: GNAT family N-acetyltransferase [Alphaproteobacteria bacterium]|nr:GNAT family N-acetyltransferase [Alphaproteobacteria bacterium]
MNGPVVSSAAVVSAAALCDAFNASFADYLLPFPTMDLAGWQVFVRRQGCDLAWSFAASRGEVVTAFALVTPRPWQRSRIAVMGARPDERGSGVAARLLDDAIAAAAARGDRWIELEAFAQNERAVKLYLSRGFVPIDSLYAYVAEPPLGTAADGDVVEIAREDAAQWACDFDRDDPGLLPWQVGGEAMLRIPGNAQAWRLGDAQMVFQDSDAAVAVTSLLDRGTAGDAQALLAALRHRYSQRVLRAPQLHRKLGPARAFEDAGWSRQPLHQLFLRRQLSG